jgi:hypothetical protein
MFTLRLAAVCVALASLIGCATDSRKDVAFQVLFSPTGQPNPEAFSAVLAVRFPPGSAISALQSFIGSLGGSCRMRNSGHLWCEVVTRSKFCASSMLGIDVTLDSSAVGLIEVTAGGVSC